MVCGMRGVLQSSQNSLGPPLRLPIPECFGPSVGIGSAVDTIAAGVLLLLHLWHDLGLPLLCNLLGSLLRLLLLLLFLGVALLCGRLLLLLLLCLGFCKSANREMHK